ncbi:MAG: NUDIX domain-containing protein [Burkholderiaceae bacterium]|jgi:8-oxo-dGTP pyrophosphatase MutT (NUDIX family)|nr:NUDIX domain-containing protein [Burkholderiaceae bacterium]
MELNDAVVDTPPRDAASMVLLRDGAPGLQVLLLRRHGASDVLGGAWVFPGGKVDAADSAADALALLDCAPQQVAALLAEPDLTVEAAAGFFVAAARETFEESGVLLARRADGAIPSAVEVVAALADERAPAFAPLLARHGLRLDTQSCVPWSRWITPRQPSVMNKRFDTRFLLAVLPPGQDACADEHEITETRWLAPREALWLYARGEIDLVPPQIMSLLHLALYRDTAAALADARARGPYRIEPCPFDEAGQRTICYPGDPAYPKAGRVLPEALPTRLTWRDKRFTPPEGLQAWF